MSKQYCNYSDYFRNLHNELDSKEYINSLYNYFKNIDISYYDFIKNRPGSDIYEYMRELNVPVPARFLEDYVKSLNNKFENGEEMSKRAFVKERASEFYNEFNKFKTRCKYNYEMTQTKCGLDIKLFGGITKKTDMKGTYYILDIEAIKLYLTTEYKIEFYVDDITFEETQS